MIDEQALRERYSRDAVPIRLGNLASSVKRLGYFIHKAKHDDARQQLFAECRLFIQWTLAETEVEIAEALAELQTDLMVWKYGYMMHGQDESWRNEVNQACAQWLQRLLELSGLLNVKPEALSE